MRNLSALLQSDSAAFNWPRSRNPVFIETQQNQGVCRILAQSPKGKDYIYNVLSFDPEHPEAAPHTSLNMTEEEVRELHEAGQWPEIFDIDKPLREARESASRRNGTPASVPGTIR